MQANQSRFYLSCNGAQQFAIIALTSSNYGLNSSYDFAVTLGNQTSLAWQQLQNQPATLHLITPHHSRIHGLITGYHYYGQQRYQLTLSSPLYALAQRRYQRSFNEQSIREILGQLFAPYPALDANLTALNATEKINLVQYNESDYEFLDRLCTRFGLIYYFVQGKEQATLHLCQHMNTVTTTLSSVSTQSLTQAHNTIVNLSHHYCTGPESIILSANCPNHPHQAIKINSTKQSPVRGQGSLYWHEQWLDDVAEAKRLATLLQQQLDWQRYILLAETDAIMLTPGMHINIKNNPLIQEQISFCLIHMRISAQQKTPNSHTHAQLLLAPSTLVYRKSCQQTCLLAQLDRFTELPQCIGQQPLHLATHSLHRAQMQNTKQVRLHFDSSNTKVTNPLFKLQPYDGIDFPLHAQTTVAIAYLDSHFNYGFIAGVLNTENSPSPVNCNNATANIIKTKVGHTLHCNDDTKAQSLLLHTPKQTNLFGLYAGIIEQVVLRSENGDINIQAGHTLQALSQMNHLIQVQGSHQESITKQFSCLTRQGDIKLLASNSMHCSAKQHIQFECAQHFIAKSEVIYLCAHNHFTMQATQAIHLAARQAKIKLQAKQIALTAPAIQLQSGQSSLQIANQKMTLTAQQIIICAPQIFLA